MRTETRILIADDHPIFRKGLRQVIETEASLKVVAEAEDGEDALSGLRELKPEVAILDIDMPKMDGFEVARALQRENLSIEVIFMTMHKEEDMFHAAMDLGVKGYIVKDSAVSDIVGSIKAVAAGQHFISPSISTYLINRNRRAASLTKEMPTLNDLTPTEQRILKLIADNKTSREIAGELFISHRTVENHRANICSKLELRGSHALLKFAIEHKSQLS
jgi:DNA-binding NarL/FixJ family response regulator